MRRYAIALPVWLLMASGCTTTGSYGPGPTVPPTGVAPDGTPRWVRRSSGAYDGPHGKAFYGVGIVQGIGNISLARQTGGDRARGEIARLFDTYIARMLKDYQRATGAGGGSVEEQDVVSAQKTITEVTLRGAEVRDHWRDPNNGALYVLAVLELSNMVRNLGGATLPRAVVGYVRKNAERAFGELDRELDKQRQADPAPSDPPPTPRKVRTGKTRVGVLISGIDARLIQTCMVGKLIDAGFDVFEGTSDVDVMVRGQLRHQRAGDDGSIAMVRADAAVRVTDVQNGNKLLVAFTDTIKAGRPDLQQAVQLAASRLCDLVVPKVVARVKMVTR